MLARAWNGPLARLTRPTEGGRNPAPFLYHHHSMRRLHRRGTAVAAGLALAALGSLEARPQPAPSSGQPSATARSARAVLDKYCVSCHSGRRATAGLALDVLDPNQAGAAAETWEKVVARLRGRSMPPAGMPRPDAASYDQVA